MKLDMFYSIQTIGPQGYYPQAYLKRPDDDRTRIPKCYPKFSKSAIPKELTGILPDVTGNEKFKMAIYEHRLEDPIERQF